MKRHRLQLTSIKARMVFFIVILVAAMVAAFTVIAINMSTKDIKDSTNRALIEISAQGGKAIAELVDGYYSELNSLNGNPLFDNIEANKQQIFAWFNKVSSQNDNKDLYITNKAGISYKDGRNLANQEFFQKAIKGENNITRPIIDKENKTMTLVVAAPLKNSSNQIIGTIIAEKDAYILTEKIDDMKFVEGSRAFMMSQDGVTIACNLIDLVLNEDSDIENLKNGDQSLAALVELEKKMLAGESGVGQYLFLGQEEYMGYSPVGDTGWGIALTSPASEIFKNIDDLRNFMLILCAAFIVVGVLIAFFIAKSISMPIEASVQHAGMLAKGDFSIEIPQATMKRKDEIGQLARAFDSLASSLNEVMANISVAADQVAAGSRQVSDSSLALSQGAAEQASAIEELTTSIEQISTQTRQNADNANEASELAERTKLNAEKGNEQMVDMLKSMEDINSSSNNISKIIKVIDDIAFQTNILSLNAAVEAARAGQHGKGFAVVAEEVRNLAARSANAAKETTDMIENSIKKVEHGTKITQVTSNALKEIFEQIQKVSTLINEIAVASNEQSVGIEQINQGIMQVSTVIQENSATSEEGASASEELSSQAELLKKQIRLFKLKDVNHNTTSFNAKELSQEDDNKKQYTEEKSDQETMASETPAQKTILLSDNEFGKY
ncbi:MAG: methyl-accepting chemotaxis protein [Bacillota bacterium]|jgi:methyl-accepting chemotaxis protein